MSDTPRTDEFCKTAGGQYTYDITGLARSLERELSTCSAKFDLQQQQLDRNAEQIAALRKDAERYGRAKRFLQYGKGTLDARGTDSAEFDALIDALPKEEGK